VQSELLTTTSSVISSAGATSVILGCKNYLQCITDTCWGVQTENYSPALNKWEEYPYVTQIVLCKQLLAWRTSFPSVRFLFVFLNSTVFSNLVLHVSLLLDLVNRGTNQLVKICHNIRFSGPGA